MSLISFVLQSDLVTSFRLEESTEPTNPYDQYDMGVIPIEEFNEETEPDVQVGPSLV